MQVVRTLASKCFGNPRLGHTIKANCMKLQNCWSKDVLKFDLFKKVPGLVSPSYFAHEFSKKYLSLELGIGMLYFMLTKIIEKKSICIKCIIQVLAHINRYV